MLPRNMPDIVATTVALLDGIACAVLALHAGHGPIVGWFGWVPKTGVVLGIAFAADGASPTIATLVCLLFAASFIFSWGYFEKISAHFQVLTTLLFNLFAWFEVMSVVAFALTGYKLEGSAISGALNFTVTNSLAGSRQTRPPVGSCWLTLPIMRGN